ncbi:spore germination protein [Peribacillus muralis]|uniref:spore germination protein n=1 Tax=Peribacillus muralis TaxID=264697 RepID=UPI001F4D784E|nr:spore germination protein [Peribacillus muralis]MCK1993469.1 spore germination protein [Peribacillus muralis]MCK2014243.1 spore germination protein [Peribacillus muralis]
MKKNEAKISKSVIDNVTFIQKSFHSNSDLVVRSVIPPLTEGSLELSIVYLGTIADKVTIQEHIMRPILQMKTISSSHPIGDITNTIEVSDIQVVSFKDAVIKHLINGQTILLLEGMDHCISADTADWKDRSLSFPQLQRSVKGPQIGFTEISNNNISLVKRYVKNPNLVIEEQTIGDETNTSVSLMFLADKVDSEILDNIRNKIQSIQLNSILDSSYIEEMICEDQITPFPLILTTERPDVTSGHILEGKIAIFCDGSPNVLIAPALFIQFFHSSEDYYEKSLFELSRLVRVFSYIISIYLIPMYIAFTLFHQELIPSELLISLASQRQMVPLPVVIEVIVFMLIFQVILESSIRLPTGITLAFSIIGTIILGQSAADAGLVQLTTLVIVSATYVLNFAVPIQPFANAIKMIRFIFVFLASIFGIYGIMLGTFVLVNHLCKLNSFGVPYLSPIAPVHIADLKDTFIRMPLKKIINTPKKYTKDDYIKKQKNE